ncbi:PadR family transcriptional regulator [Kribbella shirazensis]|uniref:DNA-binding PadR family transcriptional regulator n=1 Tax=Kribbella shirazensis TaxID=1105143 RepID=A0A7X6A4Z9_9ACTN|nr:PadR family transcriptional regulator [Kribbella shirazensis]NIK61443.1 DNA-binding PadR family transcriptional regulator [Kribbella shirazensis]
MPKAKPMTVHGTVEEHSKLFRDLLLGFVKIHVLHHASLGAVYGVGIAAELETHGYKLSPGTLYPLLHNLEASSLLVREDRIVEGKVRKYYYITPLGQQVLDEARGKLVELVDEVLDNKTRSKTGSKAVAGRKRNA